MRLTGLELRDGRVILRAVPGERPAAACPWRRPSAGSARSPDWLPACFWSSPGRSFLSGYARLRPVPPFRKTKHDPEGASFAVGPVHPHPKTMSPTPMTLIPRLILAALLDRRLPAHARDAEPAADAAAARADRPGHRPGCPETCRWAPSPASRRSRSNWPRKTPWPSNGSTRNSPNCAPKRSG